MARINWIIVSLASLLISSTVSGHHSNVEYDFTVFEELDGEVASVSWRNPHVRLMLNVRRADGSQEVWDLEAQDVNSLGRRGLGPEMISAGDTVRVAGNPSTVRERAMYVTNVLLPGGTEINTRGNARPRWSTEHIGFDQPAIAAARAAAGPAQGIFRVWMREEPGGFAAELPLTDRARAARDSWDPANNVVRRCIAPGMPSAMRLSTPHPIDFTQRDGEIVMRIELFDRVRTIHMDSSIDPAEQPTADMGYSHGQWEDDTLVIQTSRVSWPYFDNIGSIPQSEDVEIIERARLSEDGNRLFYEMTVTDPATFTEPVSASWVLAWRPDLVIEAFDCVAED